MEDLFFDPDFGLASYFDKQAQSKFKLDKL